MPPEISPVEGLDSHYGNLEKRDLTRVIIFTYTCYVLVTNFSVHVVNARVYFFQVSKWCNAGVDILASQPLERFQSADGAEKALKEIDEFLKKPQGVNLGKLNRMEKTAKELGDEALLEQVKTTLTRISEVTEMMSNREARLVL